MKSIKYIILIIICLTADCLTAQITGNIWYFSDSLGLKFNNDTVVQLSDGITQTREGTSVYSRNDSMLMYSDGETVWNARHEIMENGEGLMGATTSVQSSIILERPNTNQFYLFTTYAFNEFAPIDKGIRYSVVEISAQYPLGKIISKNNLLVNGSNESITAKKSKSFDGYWVIFPEFNTVNILVYRLDKNGLSLHASLPVLPFTHRSKSQIKVSYGGEYVALTCGLNIAKTKVCIYNFDDRLGTLSDLKTINNFRSEGLEFSSDAKYLYIRGYATDQFRTGIKNGLYQLQIDSVLQNDAINERNAFLLEEDPSGGHSAMSLTPHGQIFMSAAGGVSGNAWSAIQNPNLKGQDCGYNRHHIKFNKASIDFSMPNICIDYVLSPFLKIENGCINQSIEFSLNRNRSDSAKWIFGDGSEHVSYDNTVNHTYTSFGNFIVETILFNHNYVDTIRKTIEIYDIQKPNLGRDTLLCNREKMVLKLKESLFDEVIWNNKDTSFRYEVNKSNTVIVKASNQHCQSADTVIVSYIDCNLLIDSMCLGEKTRFELQSDVDSVKIYFGDGSELMSNSNIILHKYDSEGEFVFTVVYHKNGLVKMVNNRFEITQLPSNFLNDSTTSCSSVVLSPNLSIDNINYLWSTGEESRSIETVSTGHYGLTISQNNCISKDSIFVQVTDCDCKLLIPNSFSPNNDGVNDIFTYSTSCNISDVKLTLYNRWGQQIKTDSTSWNGNHQNKRCNAGVYLWLMEYKDSNNRNSNAHGVIHLIR